MSLARQFASFFMVGTVGFAVDAGVFVALHEGASVSIVGARATSLTLAVVTTWLLNRRTTFARNKSANPTLELVRYSIVQAVGVAINLSVFALCLWSVPALRRFPIVALMVGSAVALLFNFFSARAFAFRGRAAPDVRGMTTEERP